MSLQDKVCIITGGGSGIGRGVGIMMAQQGAKVVLDRSDSGEDRSGQR